MIMSYLIQNNLKLTIYKGVKFLISHQDAEGIWHDYKLPTGISDSWITAFVGLYLNQIIVAHELFDFEKAIIKSINWLATNYNNDGGWSYNANCPSDADSTAHVILLFQSLNYPVSKRTYDLLLTFQNHDGGFSTYHSTTKNDSWGMSHPDVTPIAALAIQNAPIDTKDRINNVVGYIQRNQNSSGLWESFWWKTPLYSTAMNLTFAQHEGFSYEQGFLRHSLLNMATKIPFEMALALNCRLKMSLYEDSLPLVQMICNLQLPDGSWPSYPNLRLTYSNCSAPWRVADAGKIFSDQNRLLTSATVLYSLSQYYLFMQSSGNCKGKKS